MILHVTNVTPLVKLFALVGLLLHAALPQTPGKEYGTAIQPIARMILSAVACQEVWKLVKTTVDTATRSPY